MQIEMRPLESWLPDAPSASYGQWAVHGLLQRQVLSRTPVQSHGAHVTKCIHITSPISSSAAQKKGYFHRLLEHYTLIMAIFSPASTHVATACKSTQGLQMLGKEDSDKRLRS